ncbi:hypothetical protein IQ264_11585 [Phormidium sp. LEGE 05292]|uniref:hypothetical protein n=1 Tax=[Phormidium] sp. LEGE 05292 TaxID=767427 RepID=UPI001881A799|nr:hypothetical protein [Phormidium sp. LEGE 05292]MBE9226066.1 hypothetical protein [Phormidium sp. LEGE 05292]
MKTSHLVLCGIVAAGVSAAFFTAISHAQTPAAPATPPPLPPLQKSCVFLKEVTTGQPQVRKVVRVGNENTDFAVPTGVRFKSYVAMLLPENTANYDARLFFKYNDGSSAEVFRKTIAAQRFQRYSGNFRSPSGRQPFQINFNVSSARNNAYHVAVMACQ